MTVDIWPYEKRQSGKVSDLEHELLWRSMSDGLLPGSGSGALNVSISGGNWFVAPGRILVAGHVVDIQTTQSGSLPQSASQTRTSIVCAFIDRSTATWTKGVMLKTGTAGAGRPTLDQQVTATGLYQVPLRTIITAPNGTNELGDDERPRLERVGLRGPDTNRPFWKGRNISEGGVSEDIWQNFGTISVVYQTGGSFPVWDHSSVREIPFDGFYEIKAQMLFEPSSANSQSLQVRLVKNPTVASPPSGGQELVRAILPNNQNRICTVRAETTEFFSKGDRIHAQVNRFSGTSVTRRNSPSSYFTIKYERGA